ncbi:MAG: archease [Gemmatimonadales bacterium]
MAYRFLPHTADLIVELEAPTIEGLFVEATTVSRSLLAGDTPVAGVEQRQISLSATSAEELILRFVREIFTEFQLDTFVPAALEQLSITETGASVLLSGERFDPARHEPQPEVKAVTRHQLVVEETANGWRAVMVLDL